MLSWLEFLATPVYAQEAITPARLLGNIQTKILNPIIALLFAGALLYFLFGLFQFFRQGAASPEAREQGGRHILWGLVGMAIMMSAYGLVNLVCHTIECTNPSYSQSQSSF